MKTESITRLAKTKSFHTKMENILKRTNSHDAEEYYLLTEAQADPIEIDETIQGWLNRMEEKYELSINW